MTTVEDPSSPVVQLERKHPLAECEKCPLFEDPKARYQEGQGPEQADIVVIGEAPTYQDAKEGKVMAGPSGQLLELVLAHHGLSRSNVYIDNVVACRSADTKVGTPPKAIKACWPRTKAAIDSRSPSTIVALGNPAQMAVLETKVGITVNRVGPPKTSKLFPGVRIIPTYHPAACLRQADVFPHMVMDIGKINLPEGFKWTPPKFKVYDDEETATKVLRELLGHPSDPLVVDIEVGLEKDTEFDHPDHYQMLCIGIGYAPGLAVVIGEEALRSNKVLDVLRLLFAKKKWIAHNGKFDMAGLQRYGSPVLAFDTMLASYLVDERRGTNGLKYLAVELLGTPQYDDEIHKYVKKGESYALVPRDILYRYNAYDVACTYELYEMYSKQLETEGLRATHDFLCEASEMLMHTEMEGVGVDIPYLDHLTDHYLDSLAKVEEELKPWVANPRSPKQVKEALHDLGFKVETTNEEMLRLLRERCGSESDALKFIDLMLHSRKETKLYGTYVKGTRKRLRKGRVHTSFLLHGTTTGRLSSRNPNLQNVPRDSTIKRMFIPEPGNVFVQGDYAQAELRVIATLAGDEYLQSVFNEGRDIHGEVAERFYGPGWTKEQRVRAKAYVFGLAYGREAMSIAMEFKISIKEAQKNMDTFFDTIPQTVEWRKQVEATIRSGKDLISPFGRHRRFHLLTRDNQKDVIKEGLSFLPQSTASDLNLHAAILLRRAGYHTRILVHDSILIECHESEGPEMAAEMKRIMEGVAVTHFTDFVKFEVDTSIGKSWGDV